MKLITIILAFSALIASCEVPDVGPQKQQTQTIYVKDTSANITVYNFINSGNYYSKEINKVNITDSTILFKNVLYLRISDNTVAKLEEGTSNLYSRVRFNLTKNMLRLGDIKLYKQIPPLVKDDKFIEANQIIVQQGFTLSYIARKYDTSIDELIRLNNLDPVHPTIYPDQILKIY